MNLLNYVLKNYIPFIVYIMVQVLNIFKIGLFKNKFVVMVLCGISTFYMPAYVGVPLFILLLVTTLILIIREQHSISKFKEYFKDKTIQGYLVVFKLINNNEISLTTTVEKFNEIKDWYENKNEESYSLKEDARYINLNKVNIIEFSYSKITKAKTAFNPIVYLLTTPAPKMIDVFSYVKGLFLAPFILVAYILYEKYMLNVNTKHIFANTTMMNQILMEIINFVTAIFVLYYVIFFVLKIVAIVNAKKQYFYEVKNQVKNKVYNYAIFNFVIIGVLAYELTSTKFF